MKRIVRFVAQCNQAGTGWLAQLKAINPGYSASSCGMPFGRLSHSIKLNGAKVIVKQGGDQVCKTEFDELSLGQLNILRDLTALGVLTGLPPEDLATGAAS